MLVQGYTGNGSTIGVPAVADQIETYLSNSSAPVKTSLHAVMIGVNDQLFNANLTAKRAPTPVLHCVSLMSVQRSSTRSAFPSLVFRKRARPTSSSL